MRSFDRCRLADNQIQRECSEFESLSTTHPRRVYHDPTKVTHRCSISLWRWFGQFTGSLCARCRSTRSHVAVVFDERTTTMKALRRHVCDLIGRRKTCSRRTLSRREQHTKYLLWTSLPHAITHRDDSAAIAFFRVCASSNVGMSTGYPRRRTTCAISLQLSPPTSNHDLLSSM